MITMIVQFSSSILFCKFLEWCFSLHAVKWCLTKGAEVARQAIGTLIELTVPNSSPDDNYDIPQSILSSAALSSLKLD